MNRIITFLVLCFYVFKLSAQSINGQVIDELTLTDFTLHFSCCFTKILHSQLNPLLNNFTMQEKCY